MNMVLRCDDSQIIIVKSSFKKPSVGNDINKLAVLFPKKKTSLSLALYYPNTKIHKRSTVFIITKVNDNSDKLLLKAIHKYEIEYPTA